MERHATLQANRVAGVSSGREVDDPTTTCRNLIDCFVDGIAINGPAIAHRTQFAHIRPGLRYYASLGRLVSHSGGNPQAVIEKRGRNRKAGWRMRSAGNAVEKRTTSERQPR